MTVSAGAASGLKRLTVLAAALPMLPACVSVQAIEPVISPPSVYQRDNQVQVEFVHPALVGVRCAERGVRFLGMPGINSGACADSELITMPNPCHTVTGGWYAETLCHELAHVNGWSHDHRGGALFARHEPIRRASESPEAIAYAAAQAAVQAEAQTPARSAPPRASARTISAPAEIALVEIEPLALSFPTLRLERNLEERPEEIEVALVASNDAAPVAPFGEIAPQRLGLRAQSVAFAAALPAPLE